MELNTFKMLCMSKTVLSCFTGATNEQKDISI